MRASGYPDSHEISTDTDIPDGIRGYYPDGGIRGEHWVIAVSLWRDGTARNPPANKGVRGKGQRNAKNKSSAIFQAIPPRNLQPRTRETLKGTLTPPQL
jgi:hypothetical protein